MNEFNEETRKKMEHGWYLCQCSEFCESGWELAFWNGKVLTSQANDMDIGIYTSRVVSTCHVNNMLS